MLFAPSEIPGVFVIELERKEDHRGFFARAYCQDEFRQHGLDPTLAQINLGYSHRRGTLRGMHYQRAPHGEVKVVRCTRGAVFDVALDLRPDSPAYRRWVGVELSAANHRLLYIPPGCAHGYQSIEDASEISYTTSQAYVAAAATGVRYNDPRFAIGWPLPVSCISDADASWPDHR